MRTDCLIADDVYTTDLAHRSPSDAAFPITDWCSLRTQMGSVPIAKGDESMAMLREHIRPSGRVEYLENVSGFGGPRYGGAILGGSRSAPGCAATALPELARHDVLRLEKM